MLTTGCVDVVGPLLVYLPGSASGSTPYGTVGWRARGGRHDDPTSEHPHNPALVDPGASVSLPVWSS